MAKIEFQLEHGIPLGKGRNAEMQYDVELRELTGADVIDASLEAEKVVFNGDGQAVAYSSNVIMGYALLCRQVDCIGEIKGPLTLNELRKMHPIDIASLQRHAEELDQLIAKVETRGRDKPVE